MKYTHPHLKWNDGEGLRPTSAEDIIWEADGLGGYSLSYSIGDRITRTIGETKTFDKSQECSMTINLQRPIITPSEQPGEYIVTPCYGQEVRLPWDKAVEYFNAQDELWKKSRKAYTGALVGYTE